MFFKKKHKSGWSLLYFFNHSISRLKSSNRISHQFSKYLKHEIDKIQNRFIYKTFVIFSNARVCVVEM